LLVPVLALPEAESKQMARLVDRRTAQKGVGEADQESKTKSTCKEPLQKKKKEHKRTGKKDKGNPRNEPNGTRPNKQKKTRDARSNTNSGHPPQP